MQLFCNYSISSDTPGFVGICDIIIVPMDEIGGKLISSPGMQLVPAFRGVSLCEGDMNTIKKCEDRFAEVDKSIGADACWLWTGKLVGGYGRVTYNHKSMGAHIYSWILENGEVPAGMVIMHDCDNTACVNPRHLTAGTQQQNILDAYRRGRRNKKCKPWKKAVSYIRNKT